jgi:hypothetical protein
MRKKATIKVKTPQEFERWRRLAEEPLRKKEYATSPTTPMEVKAQGTVMD